MQQQPELRGLGYSSEGLLPVVVIIVMVVVVILITANIDIQFAHVI